MAYPNGTDLATALVNRGILDAIPGDVTDLADIISSVCTEFERDTGWVPYLYPGGETTRLFDPPATPILFLNVGLLDITTFTVGDDAQTVEEDYWLEPAGSGPYTRIRFAYQPSGNPQTIEINGQWGYTTVLSADVERALLGKAMAVYLRDTANGVNGLGGSPTRIQQDDVAKDFGENGTLIKQFESAYDRCVMRYLAPWKVFAT